MAVMSYKCPNCGGGLTFDPKKQKLVCEYCLSEFSEEEMKGFEEDAAKKEESGSERAVPENEEAESAKTAKTGEAETVSYICPSCGAEIVTDATTAATFCYYCHNPVVLSGRVSGENLPDYVLPFAIEKKQAKEMFLSWIGKKKFVPDSFYSKEQLEKLSGVYFPYYLYSCKVDGSVKAEGEKLRTWTSGNIRYTEHKQYGIERAGSLNVKNLTRNALSKSNRELVEGVLPFDTDQLEQFQTGYLSGFLAEKRDMEYHGFEADAEQEVKNYTLENLTASITGYDSLRVQDRNLQIRDAKWEYALLPVWLMTYKHGENGKIYYFAMNGQSGKIYGKLPVDKGKLTKLFLGIFVPLFVILMIGGWFL